MSAPALARNATKAQALAYLSSQWAGYTYHNNASTPYEGMDASQLYAYLAGKDPTASPYTVAVGVSDLLLSSGIAAGVQQGTNTGLAAIGASANPANYSGLAPSWSTGLLSFLGDLTSSATWIRVAKVVVGGALLIVGLAHITGADNTVAVVARKAPLPV